MYLANLPLRILAVIWASPYTLLGLLLGLIGVCTGGRARIRRGVIEFYGGGVKWLLHRFVVVAGVVRDVNQGRNDMWESPLEERRDTIKRHERREQQIAAPVLREQMGIQGVPLGKGHRPIAQRVFALIFGKRKLPGLVRIGER